MHIKEWYYKIFKKPFTVACDIFPFYHPWNEREILFHVNGLYQARKTAKKWVRKHTSGQARILEGTVNWPEDNNEKV